MEARSRAILGMVKITGLPLLSGICKYAQIATTMINWGPSLMLTSNQEEKPMKAAKLLVTFCLLTTAAANAANLADESPQGKRASHPHPVHGAPARGVKPARPPLEKTNNLIYNGGPTITSAKVVFIFWGPDFSNPASPDFQYAQELQAFRNQFGTTPEYNVITQYSGILQSNLGTGTSDWFDNSTPPLQVFDSAIQAKVQTYLGGYGFDNSTIYEVVLPRASYFDNGGRNSCGGPNFVWCAYHSLFYSGANHVKYSAQAYPSCGGCQVAGWTDAQSQEHFISHETRETVTDPEFNGWVDTLGDEADDKCNWSPSPFIGTGGYGYQYEWSNRQLVRPGRTFGACVPTL
jgi:hypothetical protein